MGSFAFNEMADTYRSQFIRQLLGDRKERVIGDFVLFTNEEEGEKRFHCLTLAAQKEWKVSKKTDDWKRLKPIIKADKARIRAIPSYAPISDEELENIE